MLPTVQRLKSILYKSSAESWRLDARLHDIERAASLKEGVSKEKVRLPVGVSLPRLKRQEHCRNDAQCSTARHLERQTSGKPPPHLPKRRFATGARRAPLPQPAPA